MAAGTGNGPRPDCRPKSAWHPTALGYALAVLCSHLGVFAGCEGSPVGSEDGGADAGFLVDAGPADAGGGTGGGVGGGTGGGAGGGTGGGAGGGTGGGTGGGAGPALPIHGAFIQAEYLQPATRKAQLAQVFAEMAELTMDTLVVQSTLKYSCAQRAADAGYRWVTDMPVALSDVLEAASAKNIQVYVGLGYFPDDWACIRAYDDSDFAVAQMTQALDAIVARVNASPHASAQAGWYLPDEPPLANASAAELAAITSHYSRLAQLIKSRSSKPILVSPYLYAPPTAPQVTSAQLASRLSSFKVSTGIELFAIQDSAGTYSTDVGWGRGERLDKFYQQAAQTIGRNSLWSVTELFNFGQQGGVGYGGSYLPTSVYRLRKQVELTSSTHVSKRLSWIPLSHLTSLLLPSNGTVNGAARLKAAYKAAYGGGGALLRPSYSWLTAPSASYPDPTNAKLTDGMPGDPKNVLSPSWVGVASWLYPSGQGPNWVELKLDLGAARTVDWVGVQFLNQASSGVFIPSEMEVFSSANGSSWTSAGKFQPRCYSAQNPFQTCSTGGTVIGIRASPDAGQAVYDSEYTFANDGALNLTSRYLKLRFITPNGYVFIGELEVVGR